MRPLCCLLLFICLVSPPAIIGNNSQAQEELPTESNQAMQNLESGLEGPVRVEDIAATSSWANGLIDMTNATEWLGPLAPLALSPFFGVTLLSGLSLWGPDAITDNALLGAAGPLRHQGLFFTFLALTLLTSLPRLTKISKPFAQAIDRLETYAVIVILLVIKIVASMDTPADSGEVQVAMIQFGVIEMTVDTLLAIAMVINILVINSVKFFFEFLVWLTPVPFLDAVFEICNKSLCAALMAIYAFSPTLATIINLCVLLVAAVILRWISRRVRFYRTMVLDPVIARLWTSYGTPQRPELIVFPKTQFGPFKPLSRLQLSRAQGEGQTGWVLREANWWMPQSEYPIDGAKALKVCCGWLTNTMQLEDDDNKTTFTFSRRYDGTSLEQLLEQLQIEALEEKGSAQEAAVEFA